MSSVKETIVVRVASLCKKFNRGDSVILTTSIFSPHVHSLTWEGLESKVFVRACVPVQSISPTDGR